MSKNTFKRYNNSFLRSDNKFFGDNGVLYNYDNYFLIFDSNNLTHCYIFIANNFDKYLSISGKCRFKLLIGSATLNGVNFTAPFEENIYSPISHASVTLDVRNTSKDNFQKIDECIQYLMSMDIYNENERMFFASFSKFKEEFPKTDSYMAIRLETINCIISDDISQFNDFKRIFEVNLNFPYARKLKFSVTKDDQPSFIMTKEMSDCIYKITNTANDELSVAIVGPKDAGKSTLMRTVINRFFAEGYTGIYVIDGDPGQSEFSSSGSLTLTHITRPLFGPPFTHQYGLHINVIKQLFIGTLAPSDDPKLYCRSFESLYHSYLEISPYNRSPLVINTMGWPKGLGLSFLAFKLLLVNPTYIIQLKKDGSETELMDITKASLEMMSQNETLLECVPKQFESTVFILKSVVSPSHRHGLHLKPAQHRDLTMLAYIFHQTLNLPLCFSKDKLPDDYDSSPVTRLRCRIPAFVNYSAADDSQSARIGPLPLVRLRLVYSDIDIETQRTIMARCFSVQWVAICRPCNAQRYKSVVSGRKYDHIAEAVPMECFGMGLVSHVREDSCEMDILTGVDQDTLNGACLVKGSLFPPDCLLLEQRELTSASNARTMPFLSSLTTNTTQRCHK